ncbi:MAG: serine hydrolase domain-containing protein [Janthinobacterium lividum]
MIDGFCDPDFARVGDAFAANFADRGEIGAAVCVHAGGRKVVDLWGGHRDADRSLPWEADTLVCMMSVGKGMAALCVHRLIEQGRVELDRPMADYWPEFAQGGKGDVLVSHVLGSTSGVLFADSAPPGSVLDWDVMTNAIARQPAEWAAGTQGAYQSMTMGFMLGELVRRVDGRPLARYFAEEISRPLDAEYGWGLNAGQIARTADIIGNGAHPTLQAFADPSTKLGRAWHMRPAGTRFYNTPEFRGGVLPSSNGHGTARGVATIYAALLEDGLLVSTATRERMRTLSWDSECGMTGRAYRYAKGFFLDKPPLVPMGPNPGAFGHPGAGGALGFVDPEAGIAFAYAPNLMCEGAGSGERCTALVDALFA